MIEGNANMLSAQIWIISIVADAELCKKPDLQLFISEVLLTEYISVYTNK